MQSANTRSSGKIEEVKLTFKAKSAGPLPGKSVFYKLLVSWRSEISICAFLKDTELIILHSAMS